MTNFNLDSQKIDISFNEGYQSGLNWPDAWMNHDKPGGPFVSNPYSNREGYEQSLAENRAWREGWAKGLYEKVRTNRSNPLIGVAQNAAFHKDGDK